jgi:hypothetical protein
MTRLAAVTILTLLAASAPFAQTFDPPIGSGNLGNMDTLDPPPLAPSPVLSTPVCETRRMEFEDEFGLRVRDVLVCCVQGRCTYRPTY